MDVLKCAEDYLNGGSLPSDAGYTRSDLERCLGFLTACDCLLPDSSEAEDVLRKTTGYDPDFIHAVYLIHCVLGFRSAAEHGSFLYMHSYDNTDDRKSFPRHYEVSCHIQSSFGDQHGKLHVGFCRDRDEAMLLIRYYLPTIKTLYHADVQVTGNVETGKDGSVTVRTNNPRYTFVVWQE